MSKGPDSSVFLKYLRISNEGTVVDNEMRVVEEAQFCRALRVIERQGSYSK